MDKQEQAQRFAEIMLKHGYESDLCFDENLYQMVAKDAWILTDAMQAEWDSRINKDRPTVLHEEFQPTGYETCSDEWQPDWSQAPKNMNYFFMNKDGSKYWSVNKPNKPNFTEHVMNFFECGGDCYSYATSQDYQGDWRDSLRSRP